MDKKSLTERDICTKFILPAVKRAGWDDMLQVREAITGQDCNSYYNRRLDTTAAISTVNASWNALNHCSRKLSGLA